MLRWVTAILRFQRRQSCRGQHHIRHREMRVLKAAASLREDGRSEFTGHEIAKRDLVLRGYSFPSIRMIPFGTLHRSLHSLECHDLLASRVETRGFGHGVSEVSERPARRFYHLLNAGLALVANAKDSPSKVAGDDRTPENGSTYTGTLAGPVREPAVSSSS